MIQRPWDFYMIVNVGVEVSLRLYEINERNTTFRRLFKPSFRL